jgi:hypothetical protein
MLTQHSICHEQLTAAQLTAVQYTTVQLIVQHRWCVQASDHSTALHSTAPQPALQHHSTALQYKYSNSTALQYKSTSTALTVALEYSTGYSTKTKKTTVQHQRVQHHTTKAPSTAYRQYSTTVQHCYFKCQSASTAAVLRSGA